MAETREMVEAMQFAMSNKAKLNDKNYARHQQKNFQLITPHQTLQHATSVAYVPFHAKGFLFLNGG
jgi:hypothetical protein